jgi:hypothetical protein
MSSAIKLNIIFICFWFVIKKVTSATLMIREWILSKKKSRVPQFCISSPLNPLFFHSLSPPKSMVVKKNYHNINGKNPFSL